MEFSTTLKEQLKKICLYIHLDTFMIDERIRVREASYLGHQDRYPVSLRFDLREYAPLSDSDREFAELARQHTHGLHIFPQGHERAANPNFLNEMTTKIYENKRTEERHLVAFYGGENEGYYLWGLDIPSIQLKYSTDPMQLVELTEKYNGLDCGYHMHGLRCGRAYLAAYRDWIAEKLKDEAEDVAEEASK